MSDESAAQPQNESAPKPSRRRRWLKRLGIAAGVIAVLYVVGGFVGVPLVARHIILPRVAEHIDGTVNIEGIYCNPFRLRVWLEGLDVADRNAEPALAVQDIVVNASSATLYTSGFVLDEIRVNEPVIHATLNADSQFNLLTLIKPSETPEPRKPLNLPALTTGPITIAGGKLHLADEARHIHFTHRIEKLTFDLGTFSTKPSETNPHDFEAISSAGESIAWTGTLQLNPLTLRGTLRAEKLALLKYYPLIHPLVQFKPVSGEADATVEVAFAPAASPRVAKVEVKSVAVRDLSLAPALHEPPDDASTDPFLTLDGADVSGITLDLAGNKIALEAANAHGLVAAATRQEDGRIDVIDYALSPDLLAKLQEPKAPADPDAPKKPLLARPDIAANPQTELEKQIGQVIDGVIALTENLTGEWDITINRVSLDDGVAKWTDQAVPGPAKARAGSITATLGPITSSEQFRTPLDASLKVNGKNGRDGHWVKAKGDVLPLRKQAALVVDVDALALAPFSPYIEQALKAELRSGNATVAGRVTAAITDDKQIKASFDGKLDVADFAAGPKGDGAIADLVVASASVGGLTYEGEASASIVPGEMPQLSAKGNARVAALSILGRGETEPTLSVGEARVTDLDAGYPSPGVVAIDSVEVTDPAARAGLNADGKPQLEHLVDAAALEKLLASAPAKPPSSEPASILPIEVNIAHILVTRAAFTGTDAQYEPAFTMRLSDITGDLSDVSTDPASRTQMNFRGLVQDHAAFQLQGEATPLVLPMHAETKFALKPLKLDPFDPYSTRFVGYNIDSGTVTVDVNMLVDHDRLEGTASVDLHQLRLGDSAGKDALIKLPIKQGLALLEDRSGHVRLDVPIRGDLAEPGFSIESVAVQAITSTVTNVLSSPLAFVAGAVGGKKDVDYSHATFAPADASLSTATKEKLDVIAKVLFERPKVSVALMPHVGGPAELRAMKKQALRAQAVAAAGNDDEAAAMSYHALVEQRYASFAEAGELLPEEALEEADTSPQPEFAEAPEDVANPPADSGEMTLTLKPAASGSEGLRRPRGGRRGVRRPVAREPAPTPSEPAETTPAEPESAPDATPAEPTEPAEPEAPIAEADEQLAAGEPEPAEPSEPTPADAAESESAEAGTDAATAEAGSEADQPQVTFTEMERQVLARVAISEEALGELGRARADAAKQYLLSANELDAARITIEDPELIEPGTTGTGAEPGLSFDVR